MTTDTSTLVLWLQTAHWHADLRLPAERPDFSARTSLADATPAQREWLARQKGFAGITEVTSTSARIPVGCSKPSDPPVSICQWHRQFDRQPATGARDIGTMVFHEGGERVEEYGLDQEYHETWIRLPGSAGATAAWCREPAAAGSPPEILLVAGCFFMLVHPQGTQALDLELSFGAFAPATGSGEIAHSTLPWREGQGVQLSTGWTPLR